VEGEAGKRVKKSRDLDYGRVKNNFVLIPNKNRPDIWKSIA